MDIFTMKYEIRWADLDANGHVSYSAYIDATADLRYHYFSQNHFPPQYFENLGIGPIYTSITANFLREVRYGETVTITYQIGGLSPLGARWKVHHDFLKASGKKAVEVTLVGTLLDMKTRKTALPPPDLLAFMQQIPRRSDFEEMSDSRWLK